NIVEEETKLTPLHYAAKNGRLDAVQFLYGKKVALNAIDKFGRTPLYMAVLQKQGAIVQFLLEKQANPNVCCQCKTTAVSKAAEYGDKKMLTQLLEAGAAWNTDNVDGESPKQLAARNGHGLPWDIFESEQREKLVEAAANGDIEHVGQLIRLGVDPTERPDNSMSALETACAYGRADVVKFLLYDASVGAGTALDRIKSMGGITVIHEAARKGHTDVVVLLLGAGLAPDSRDADSMTALHRAAARGQKDVVELLLRADSSMIDARGLNDATPLHQAALQGRGDMVTFLLGK
ncbi:ankyrin repeat-containing domain protein, partial [Dendryphion nanum]